VVSTLVVLFVPPVAWLGNSIRNTGLYSIVGLSNYALIWSSDGYFSPRAEFNPFTHTWSLGVEEQFYLIAPAIVYFWLAWHSQTGAKKFIPVGILTLAALVSGGIAAHNSVADPDAAFYLLPSRFWELACGVLLFQIQYERRFRAGYLTRFAAPLGLVLILCALLYSDKAFFPFPWALASVAGSTLLIASFTMRDKRPSPIKRFFSTGPIVYVGNISYSLYLWHWPIFVMLRWTVGLDGTWIIIAAVISAFLIAIASYHFVEQPIRDLRRFIVRPHWQTVTAGVAIIFLSLIVTRGVYASSRLINLSVVKNDETWSPYILPPIVRGNCKVTIKKESFGTSDVDGIIPTECSNNNLLGRRLFVIGDSHAGAYRRLLFDLARDEGVEIWIYSIGCSVANLSRPLTREPRDCPNLTLAALGDIKRRGKPNDIVFLSSLRMERLSDQWGAIKFTQMSGGQGSAITDDDRNAALDEARRFIQHVRQFGFQVLIDAPMPVFVSNNFRCSDWFNKMNPSCSAGQTISKRYLEDRRQRTMQALSILKSEFPEISIWDPFYHFCQGDFCSSWDARGPLFFDGDHLTGHANQVLYPYFKSSVEKIWKNLAPKHDVLNR